MMIVFLQMKPINVLVSKTIGLFKMETMTGIGHLLQRRPIIGNGHRRRDVIGPMLTIM